MNKASRPVVDAQNKSRIFMIHGLNLNVNISNMNFTHGNSTKATYTVFEHNIQSGINSSSFMKLVDVLVDHNTSVENEAAVEGKMGNTESVTSLNVNVPRLPTYGPCVWEMMK